MAVEVGDKAPGFTLPADSWENEVSLNDYLGERPVALFFYPGDWSTPCTDQLGKIQKNLDKFEQKGAQVLAISVDSPWSHQAFAQDRGISFPLLSDFHREVVRSYGVEHEGGFSNRAYVIVDKEGTVRAKKVEEVPSNSPDLEEVLQDLDKAL